MCSLLEPDPKSELKDVECCRWISLLIQCIDFTQNGAENHLKTLIKHNQSSVLNMDVQREHVKELVSFLL